MKFTWFKSGSFNVICDVCGFKFKQSEVKERWDGLMVCPDDWEIRHPQELIRPIQDQNKLPWTRPEGADQFIDRCTASGRQGIADFGTADCAQIGLDLGIRTDPALETNVANKPPF